jgi:hypothetical protein
MAGNGSSGHSGGSPANSSARSICWGKELFIRLYMNAD